MIWLLLIAGGALFWAWKAGRLPSLGPADVGAAVGVVAGLRLLSQGKPLLAAIALGGSLYWFYRRTKQPRMPIEEARRLLELPPGADGEAIRAAHRRIIARVHPDVGGSTELARRVNSARDTLLSELRRKG